MFSASRRVEIAARLEYMAEARGRPRPGEEHPDAEVEDPDNAMGGDKDKGENEDAFESDDDNILPE